MENAPYILLMSIILEKKSWNPHISPEIVNMWSEWGTTFKVSHN